MLTCLKTNFKIHYIFILYVNANYSQFFFRKASVQVLTLDQYVTTAVLRSNATIHVQMARLHVIRNKVK